MCVSNFSRFFLRINNPPCNVLHMSCWCLFTNNGTNDGSCYKEQTTFIGFSIFRHCELVLFYQTLLLCKLRPEGSSIHFTRGTRAHVKILKGLIRPCVLKDKKAGKFTRQYFQFINKIWSYQHPPDPPLQHYYLFVCFNGFKSKGRRGYSKSLMFL